MATNNLTVAGGSADLEISDGTNSYGYLAAKGSTISESRGSGFAGSVSSGAPTYQDAQPFQRTAWENFNGGFGQVLQNKVFGGTGMGGDSTRYFSADAYTLRGNALMPGMARDLVAPNYTGILSSPLATDWEAPHGVLPSAFPSGASGNTRAARTVINFAAPTANVEAVRILVKFSQQAAGNVTLEVDIDSDQFVSDTITPTTYEQYSDFRWVTCYLGGIPPSNTFFGAGNHTVTVTVTSGNTQGILIGCFVGTSSGTPEVFQPYIQLCRDNGSFPFQVWPYKSWQDPLQATQVVYNSTTINVMGAANSTLLNFSDTTQVPRSYGAGCTYMGSIVFNNQLYVGSNNTVGPVRQTQMWTAAQCATLAAPSGTATTFVLGPACVHEGQIILYDPTDRTIKKWDGVIADAPTTIINADKIGSGSSNGQNPINSLVIFRGMLYIFKAEGVFQVYDNISDVTTNKVPRIIQVVNLFDQQDTQTGKYVAEHQGTLCFNIRNLVYQLMPSGGQQPNQVTVITAPFQPSRRVSTDYVNGMTTNGQELYVSYSSSGVVAFNGQGWHPIAPFYGVANYNTPSGLRYVFPQQNSQSTYLYCADQETAVTGVQVSLPAQFQELKIPLPVLSSNFTTQFYLANQNKCGYWISSVFDADLANINKFLESVALRGSPSGFNYKIVAATWVSGSPNFRTIIDKTLNEGLIRDRWLSPQTPNAATNPPVVVTKLLDGSGNPTATTAPCYYQASEFQNAQFTAEKFCSDDDVARPVSLVSCALIVYFWNASGIQYDGSATKSDISYLESIVLRFLATQKYVAIYQVRLDLQLLANEIGSQLTNSVYDATVAFLRTRALSLTPSTFTFYDMTVSSTQTSRTAKTVKGFMQNFRPEVDPNNSSPPGTLQGMVSFNILSLAEE